jgi:hypothetical protein
MVGAPREIHECDNCHEHKAERRCPCTTAWYCTTKCQKAAWPAHKDECKAARARTAAAEAALKAAVAAPPKPWFLWEARQLAEHCIAAVVRSRHMRERGGDAPQTDEFAQGVLAQGHGAGLAELHQALRAARGLFVPDSEAALQAPGEDAEEAREALENHAEAVRRLLHAGATALLGDPDFAIDVDRWVLALFQPELLGGGPMA